MVTEVEAAPRLLKKPEVRVALFYFTMMMPTGASVVYAGIWFLSNGIGADQIGIINAVPVMLMVFMNLTIGRIADRARDWRTAIVTGATFQGLATLGLFFVNDFWGILAVWTLSILPNTAIGPVADAATMRMTQRNGTSFGPIRACSTIGYTLAVAVTGVLVDRFGGQIFVPLFVGLNLLKAAMAQSLPQFRVPGNAAPAGQVRAPAAPAGRLRDVLTPGFVLPLAGYAMAFSTHFILNAFQAVLWKAQGISEAAIGVLILIGALAEVGMMLFWKRVSFRFSPLHTLLFAAVVSAFRWFAMGLAPPLEVLVGLQLLHAVTFGMAYLSAVHFVAEHTSEDIAAEAQSFFTVVQQTTAIVAVTAFGWLAVPYGAQAYFASAALAALGFAVILMGSRLHRNRVA
jgi:PPP family 3-phenylpropionic acid transporter